MIAESNKSPLKMDQFLLIFLITLGYILILLTLKYFGIGKKISSGNNSNCCPDCGGLLIRIRRTQKDQFKKHITFRIFDSRRYVCNNCGWEGLRWEDSFRPSKN